MHHSFLYLSGLILLVGAWDLAVPSHVEVRLALRSDTACKEVYTGIVSAGLPCDFINVTCSVDGRMFVRNCSIPEVVLHISL